MEESVGPNTKMESKREANKERHVVVSNSIPRMWRGREMGDFKWFILEEGHWGLEEHTVKHIPGL